MIPPELLAKAVVLAAFMSCVAGFLACCLIVALARHAVMPLQSRVSAGRWAATFFAGAGLLLINCAMGPRAPLPVAVAFDGVIGLGSVVLSWMLACAGGYTVAWAAREYRMARESERIIPFRHGHGVRLLRGLLCVLLVAGLGGCGALSPFAAAEDATYRAIAPEYVNYVTADPSMTAAAKARRQRLVQLWRADIDEQLHGPTTQPAGSAPVVSP